MHTTISKEEYELLLRAKERAEELKRMVEWSMDQTDRALKMAEAFQNLAHEYRTLGVGLIDSIGRKNASSENV